MQGRRVRKLGLDAKPAMLLVERREDRLDQRGVFRRLCVFRVVCGFGPAFGFGEAVRVGRGA
jgi:hypothetical protein